MSELLGIARFRFLPGKRDEYLRLAEQANAMVAEKDSGALQYDLFLNDDQTECMMVERYRDSAAAMEHAANVGPPVRGHPGDRRARPRRAAGRSQR